MAANRPTSDAEKVHIEKIDAPLLAVMNLYDLHPQVRASSAENGLISMDMVSATYISCKASRAKALSPWDSRPWTSRAPKLPSS